MNNCIQNIKTFAASIGFCVGWFFGNVGGAFIALLVFSACDIVTGVVKAVLNHELSSEKGRRGAAHKIIMFIIVGVAHILDIYVFDSAACLRECVIYFYIANEGLSILENAAIIGLPIPAKLKNVLIALEKEGDDDGKEKDI